MKDRKHLKLPDTVDYSLYAPHLSAPREVTWEISYACNLRCPHCFTASGKPADGELNTGQALAVIDKLARAKVFSLLLSGGEPLLRPDILTLLCRLSTTNMRLDVGTNGVDIPKKVLKSLRRYRVSHAHVSIDGMGDRHDRFRGKKGAFDAACSTISALKKEHIGVSISTSVTSRNIDDLEDIIGLALDLGCNGFKAIPFFPVGRGRGKDSEMGLGPDEYYQLYRMLVGKERELKGKLTVDVETCFPFLFDEPQPERAQDGPMGCAAGNDTICIGSDGTIYPCPFLRDFPLGNITHGELVDVWNEAPILRMLRRLRKSDMLEPCRACEYAPKPCKGRCRAAAYLAHGDIRAADPTCFIHCGAFS